MKTLDTGVNDLNESHLKLVHAFIECSEPIQKAVRAMFEVLNDSETTPEEKAMAMHTIADCLLPNFHHGKLGMDYETSEREAADADTEFDEIVGELDSEEEYFAKKLAEAIDKKAINQTELAQLVGVSQPAISNMLRRKCRPHWRTIQRLSDALGVETSFLWPFEK